MLRDSGSEGDAGMCNFREYEVFSLASISHSPPKLSAWPAAWQARPPSRINFGRFGLDPGQARPKLLACRPIIVIFLTGIWNEQMTLETINQHESFARTCTMR